MSTKTPPRPSSAKATPPAQTTPPAHDQERRIVQLDPAAIVRDECNARTTDTEADAELIASVEALGVEEPISVRPRPDGTYGAFKGWRRAQAQQIANATAKEGGRPERTISAFVRDDLVGRDGWTRFLSLTENKNREQMSERDTVQAVELCLLDMNDVEQTDACRAMGLKRGAAKTARKAAQLSDAALRSASAEGMDLEQMADLSEVESVTGAQRRLEAAKIQDEKEGKGGRGHWDHIMAQLRQAKAEDETREQTVKELAEAGIPLLKTHFSWGQKDPSKPLSDLTTPLGNPLTGENHAGCPGHSARLDHEGQPVWHCSDPAAHGHKVRPVPKKPRTAEDEAQAAERRKVIARNKAWTAAQGPRKDFIAKLCAGRALPDEARKLALRTVVGLPYHYEKWVEKKPTEDLARFLGVKDPQVDEGGAASGSDPFGDLVERTGKPREMHVVFAGVAAAFEYDLREKNAWRNLFGHQARWLMFLEALGYTLSEVEQEALATHRPKHADAESGTELREPTDTDGASAAGRDSDEAA
ncbi:ParB/RepB/Spo0J family partition protein [Streptomyces melanosporofaciens]|uniref:Chromosome segregation protein Spo0J, contains ParB-like nuclease domain n=1 Tax=Streptomyces melanosporofaciens TaxID=67327 RepID=A0A1H4ICS2_STRMJ|nr:ParB/RepB/Spo0J family partition protein [Streptomyces melanosporofaciens]SEB31821.1 Chromosome segregation protein Spo0J, contains ParB-like nuclease domain [Streptomyces melanosporofaciens]